MTQDPKKQVSRALHLLQGGSVKLQVEARVNGQRTEVEIAVARELAPQVAIALLATIASDAGGDGLPPALEPLAVAVVPSRNGDCVCLQMLFEKGSVLPLEMPISAGEQLRDALDREFPPGAP